MEYVYAAMVLHAAGKKVDEEGLSRVLQAAGAPIDEARAKALVAALEGIDIDEAIKSATIPGTAPAVAPASKAGEKKGEKKVEEKKEEKKEAESLEGLSALFG